MCGRFGQVFDEESLRNDLPLSVSFSIKNQHRYNCAPGQNVYCGISKAKVLRFGELQWGVQPEWSNRRIINATWEKFDRPYGFWSTWKRCIVPSTGFYEWSGEKSPKQAVHIHPSSVEIMYFAGIWTWIEKSKAALVILTTASEDWMSHVHHRQPIIIQSESVEAWLNGKSPDLISPLAMTLTPVGSYVNKVGNDGPQCWGM